MLPSSRSSINCIEALKSAANNNEQQNEQRRQQYSLESETKTATMAPQWLNHHHDPVDRTARAVVKQNDAKDVVVANDTMYSDGTNNNNNSNSNSSTAAVPMTGIL